MTTLPDFIWTADAQGNATESVAWRAYTGQSVEEIKGLGWLEALHPDDREPMQEKWLYAVSTRTPYEIEYRLRGRDGQYRFILSRGVPVPNERGEVQQWVGFCTDITERKNAEADEGRAARANEQLRRSLLAINDCPDLDSALACLLKQSLLFGGLDGGCIYLLEGPVAVLRHHVNLPVEFISGVERRPLTLDFIQAVLNNPGEVLNVTRKFPAHHPAGGIHGQRHVYSLALVAELKPFGFMNLVSLVPNPPGDATIELIRILVMEVESTFKRMAVTQRLQSVLSTMAEGLVLHGADGRITDCNPSAEHILGLSRKEILGRAPLDPCWRAVRPDGSDFPAAEHPAAVTLRTSQPVRDVTMGIWQPDGRQKWININTQPVKIPGDTESCSVVVSFSDITQRRQLEKRMRQSQKMAGIGQLAGGMAHEFNNILTALMMNLELAGQMTAEVPVQERLTGALALTNRAADLVRQLLAFSRKSVASIERFDLAAETARQLTMLKPLLGEEIVVEFHPSATRSWVNADKNLLAQVIFNLCVNARDAMHQGGRLTLQLSDAAPSRQSGESSAPADWKPQLCLSFTDTGCGMDATALDRLFEPFFTTKAVGQGTGLGLATAQGIVEQHGGRITVESEPGRGSTFRVWLPSQLPPANSTLQTWAGQPAGRGVTILLVDDNLSSRTTMRLFLAGSGYKVLDAAAGREALALWHRHSLEIQLIYIKMTMPGDFSGLQFMELILTERPGMKAVVVGDSRPELIDLEKVAAANLVYLPNQVPPATILEIIGNYLSETGNPTP